MSTQLRIGKIYRWPLVMLGITFAGLLFALFGDGAWDAISWILLAIPLGVIVRSLVIGAPKATQTTRD